MALLKRIKVLNTTEHDANPMEVDSNGNPVIYGLANGNVGIGTASPTQKLDVVGSIKASVGLIGNYVETTGDAIIGGDTEINGVLTINANNSPANTDPIIYFADDESDTAHAIKFDDSEQKFDLSNGVNVGGSVSATTATFSGEITAPSIKIGSWRIIPDEDAAVLSFEVV